MRQTQLLQQRDELAVQSRARLPDMQLHMLLSEHHLSGVIVVAQHDPPDTHMFHHSGMHVGSHPPTQLIINPCVGAFRP